MAEGLLLPSNFVAELRSTWPKTCSVAEWRRDWPKTWPICRTEELSSPLPKAYLAEQNFVLVELNILPSTGRPKALLPNTLHGRRHYCRAEEIKAGHSFLPNTSVLG